MSKITFTPFPEIRTERLKLRQLLSEDENAIMKLRSDEGVNEFIIRPKSISLEEAGKLIVKLNGGIIRDEWIYWAITLRENETLIGTICLWNIDKAALRGEIGFELLPEYQGKGLMKEALTRVLHYGFKKMNLLTIDGFANKNNVKSIALMKKNTIL